MDWQNQLITMGFSFLASVATLLLEHLVVVPSIEKRKLDKSDKAAAEVKEQAVQPTENVSSKKLLVRKVVFGIYTLIGYFGCLLIGTVLISMSYESKQWFLHVLAWLMTLAVVLAPGLTNPEPLINEKTKEVYTKKQMAFGYVIFGLFFVVFVSVPVYFPWIIQWMQSHMPF